MVKEKIKTNKYIIIDNFTGKTCIDYTEQDACNAASCGWNCTCSWQNHGGGVGNCVPSYCDPPTIPCPSNYWCIDDSGNGIKTCTQSPETITNATTPENGERKKSKPTNT